MQTSTNNLTDPNTPTQPPLTTAAVPSEPIKPPTIKEKAAAHTDKALEALAKVLDDEKAGAMAKIAAATALLDRGHGKPTQYVENTVKVQTLPELLKEIGQAEKRYQEVVDVQIVEPKQIEAKPLTIEDLL